MGYRWLYNEEMLNEGFQKVFDECELEEFFDSIKHITIYEVLSFTASTSGAVTVPPDATVDTNHFGKPGQIILSEVSGGAPTNISPTTNQGKIITGGIDSLGNITLSDAYTGDLAIVWGFDIKQRDYPNLTVSEVGRIIAETVDDYRQSLTFEAARKQTTTNSYLSSNETFTNLSPFIVPFDAVLTSIVAANDGTHTWTAEVHNNGVLIPGATATVTASDNSITTSNILIPKGSRLMLYLNGTQVLRPRIIINLIRE